PRNTLTTSRSGHHSGSTAPTISTASTAKLVQKCHQLRRRSSAVNGRVWRISSLPKRASSSRLMPSVGQGTGAAGRRSWARKSSGKDSSASALISSPRSGRYGFGRRGAEQLRAAVLPWPRLFQLGGEAQQQGL